MTMYLASCVVSISEAAHKAERRKLTNDEIFDIMTQNAIVLAGTVIGVRVSKPMLEGVRLQGTDFGNKLREINLNRTQLKGLAAKVSAGKDLKLARNLVEKDLALIEKEGNLLKQLVELAKEPQKAKKMGLTEEHVHNSTMN